MTREEAIETIRKCCPKVGDSQCDFESALRELVPELAESEDERIRRELITALKDLDRNRLPVDPYPYLEWVKWLEKQEEQKPVDKCAGCNNVKGCVTCVDGDQWAHIGEQKPDSLIYDKDLDKAAREFYLSGGADSPVDSTGLVPIVRMAEFGATWMKKRMEKEQKPAESISQLTVQGKGYKICPRCKERMVRDDSMVYTSMPPQYGYECPKCGEMEFDTVMYDNPEIGEQKSAEWSKNDTVFLNDITDFFENKTVRLQHDLDMYAHWLKNLPERFVPQPKPEWTEADEVYLEDALWCAEKAEKSCKDGEDKGACWSAKRWLKSLPERFNLSPKQEWSEVELEFRGEKVKVKRPFFRDDNGRGYSTTEQDDDVAWYALRAWAESHGYTPFELYPRGEWSEEDEKTLDCIINTLDRLGYAEFCKSSREEDIEEERFYYKEIQCLKKLKSLHPQPKVEWSEEDSKRYISIGTTLGTSVVLSKEDYDANMAWLRELVNAKKYSVPKPHWKPSEEQMKALLNAEGFLRAGLQHDSAKTIAELYEHLKKL